MQRDGMSIVEPIKDSLDLALRVGDVLDALGCDYFVGGSVASSLHGEPRATNDIDFVVAMHPQRVQAFAEKLGVDFEVDTDMLRDALIRGSCANFFYLPLVTKIVFLRSALLVTMRWSFRGASACGSVQRERRYL